MFDLLARHRSEAVTKRQAVKLLIPTHFQEAPQSAFLRVQKQPTPAVDMLSDLEAFFERKQNAHLPATKELYGGSGMQLSIHYVHPAHMLDA